MAFVLIPVLLLAAALQGAEPVGLLTFVSGDVRIFHAAGGNVTAARAAELITAGDRVLTGHNSEAGFLFCPGTRAGRIPADADILFEAAGIRARKGKLTGERKVPACRLPSNLALGPASEQQAGMLRLRGSHLFLRFPSQTNIATLRPAFRWTPVDHATSYDVTLMTREERVLWRHTVTAPEMEYPREASPLEWGHRYWWRVAARGETDTQMETGSNFLVLPEEQAKAVEAAAQELDRLLRENPSDRSPQFLLAFLYEQNGMLYEAARIYSQLGSVEWVQERLASLAGRLGWDRLEPGAFR